MERGLLFAGLLLSFTIFLSFILFFVIKRVISPSKSTPENIAKQIAEIINAKKNEVVADLGCGNAKTLIEIVSKNGSKGIGFEFSPFLAISSLFNKHLAYTTQLKKAPIKILAENFLTADLSNIDIFYMYLPQNIIDLFERQAPKYLTKGIKIYIYDAKFTSIKHVKSYKLGNEKFLYEY